MTHLFSGVGVALATIFEPGGDVDAAATADLAAQLVELGVRSVLVAGTTGEAAALSPAERSTLVGAVRAAVPAQVPVLAGTGAASSRAAADLTVAAFDAGADAALVLSPAGVADPRAYYDGVADAAAGRPVLAYHFPAASPPGVGVELLADLPVVGIKDSSADPERLLRELTAYDGDVYVGAAAMLTMAGALGATGAILNLANVEPEKCAAAFAGDGRAQLALTEAHLTASRDFPAGVKSMIGARFGFSTTARVGR